MISIPEIRRLLGPAAAGLTDAEVERIRACGYVWADAIFEWWLRKKNGRLVTTDRAKEASREVGQ